MGTGLCCGHNPWGFSAWAEEKDADPAADNHNPIRNTSILRAFSTVSYLQCSFLSHQLQKTNGTMHSYSDLVIFFFLFSFYTSSSRRAFSALPMPPCDPATCLAGAPTCAMNLLGITSCLAWWQVHGAGAQPRAVCCHRD